MKKIIALLLLLVLLVGLFCGCNQQLIDTTWSYERAIVYSPGGEVVAEGRVSSWKDYENSDSIQVVIDGKSYYTHLSNVVLISEQLKGAGLACPLTFVKGQNSSK